MQSPSDLTWSNLPAMKQQDWGCSARNDSEKSGEITSWDSDLTNQGKVPKKGSLVTVAAVDNHSDHQVNARWQVRSKWNP